MRKGYIEREKVGNMLFDNIIVMSLFIILLFYYIFEQSRHNKRIFNIKYRIHINGIRGKSSVTRLIGKILRESDIKTFTKTTGSAARLIDHNGTEHLIKRRAANIIEQVSIVKTISKHNPEAFVVECMAVTPLLQQVCEEKMIQSLDLLIANVVMPKMSGRDLTNQLLLKYPKMKVLYISGYTDDVIVHHGVLYKGLPFLQKPYTSSTLSKKVREVLEST